MLLFAHRGFSNRSITENTLEAFQNAIDHGADGIEFDLRMSRDGIPMVVHDENLHRIAGDARRIHDLTRKELQLVKLRSHGTIPTLNDVTSSFSDHVQFDIELKDSGAREVLIKKLKTSSGLRDRSIISSFVFEDLQRVREEVPGVRTLLLSRTWPVSPRGIRAWKKIKSLKPWAVGFPVNAIKRRYIPFLHMHGFQVASWDLQPLKRESRKLLRYNLDVAIAYKLDVFPLKKEKG
ncbi:MAG: glycerophosphodiester phosphodiesterase [bacterium]|nr:glycerophosphodiester phosphodiesterase [bacterium]